MFLISRRAGIAALGAVGALVTTSTLSAQEVTLRWISSHSKRFPLIADYMKLTDEINALTKGKVKFQYIGGPEAVPRQKQGDALRRGTVDAQTGPPTMMLGIVPEADALLGATADAAEARKNGGFALLNKLGYNAKIKSELLSWSHSGSPFYIYLRDKPKMKPDGSVDFSGLKIRSSPTYRAFFLRLKATPVVVSPSEILTALQRGAVDGTAWPGHSVIVLGFQRVAKYRVEPPFLDAPMTFQVNLKSWSKVPEDAQKIIRERFAKFERKSSDIMRLRIEKEQKALREKFGMIAVVQKADSGKKYQEMAYDAVWDRLAKSAPESAKKLRPYFYKSTSK